MTSISTLLATGFGIGYLPAPGTLGTLLLGLPAVFLLSHIAPQYSQHTLQAVLFSVGLMLLLNAIAVGVISFALPELQTIYVSKDPQVIVLDEVVGLLWVFIAVPLTFTNVSLGFLLFRLFDITKFWFIGWGEQLPGAFGIVVDDVLAGIAAHVVLHTIMVLKNMYF